MSITNLFIRSNNNIGGLKFDGWISESHEKVITVTKNPVETGVDIVDHAIIQPARITLEIVMTDSPFVLQRIFDIIDSASRIFGTSTEENVTRSVQAYLSLEKLADARQPIEVQTGLKLYENMVITKISTPVVNKQSLDFKVELEEVIITTSIVQKIPASQLESGDIAAKGSSPSVDGRRNTTSVSPDKNKSVLKSITDFLG